MRKQTLVRKGTSLYLFLLLFSVFSYAQVTSNFSTSDDGWVYLDAATGANTTPTYSGTGGNPNGNISVTTSSGLVGFYWIAPSKFTGNLSSSYNLNLTFDMKVSSAGTDNSIGDVILTNTAMGATLVYQLPAKPSAGAWTSYSIQLNEAQWHYGCPTCSAPDQIAFKQILTGISKVQIRLKYLSGNTFAYTSQLDNVVLNTASFAVRPTITSISPASGLAGTTVTITGSNFNSTASQNTVYFKGTKATVTSASGTQLQVTVPTSASYGPVTVENLGTGLQGISLQSFNPLFDNNKDYGGRIIQSSMKMGYSTVLPTNNAASNNFGNMDKGDLDGDGWVDFVATETSTAKIYAFRNLGTGGGDINASSFASAITLPSMSSIPGGGASLSEVIVVDVDSDGKLDVAASTSSNYGGGKGFLTIYRNTSTPGSISFASPVFFPYNYYSSLYMATGDLDGDGRTDFAFTTGTSPGNLFISQNFSTPGNIDFSYGSSISAATTSGYSDVVIGDLTGDGKPEIVCPGYNAAVLSVYQNNSSAGTISMASPFTVPASVAYTVQLVMADFDADNKQDMAWSVYGANSVYFTKNLYSGGTFDATAFGTTIQVANKLANPLGISVGDINADGQADVIMSGYTDLAVLQNVGTAGNLSATSFNPTIVFQGSSNVSTNVFGLSPVVADVDGDNKPEAAFISSAGGLAAGAAGVYIFHNESFQPPQITAVNPSSTPSGSTVTVTGKYLNTKSTTPQVSGIGIVTPASNVSNTSLQISAPTGSSDNRISATLHGLQAFSPTQFYTQLNGGAGGAINSSTFGGSVDYALSSFAANQGLAVADYDRDGKPDIIIDDNGTAKIYANTISSAGATITSGSFTKSASTLNSAAHLRATDLDGDGILDIVTTGSAFAGQGISPSAIAFSASQYTSVNNTNQILVNHDFNLDGKPEVVSSNTSNQIQVFENFTNTGAPFVYNGALGSLSTSPLTYSNAGSVVGLTAADFDGDGFEDIAYGLGNTVSTLNVLLNAGLKQVMTSAQFTGPSTFSGLNNAQYITTADFDGDGKMDIALGYYSTSAFVSVYFNTSTVGSLSFTRQDLAAPAYCNGLEVGDIDGDGRPELVSINNPSGSNGSFSIFRNTSNVGSISFAAAVTYSLSTTVPKILALADVNLDDKTDIIISRTGPTSATLSIFQNLITFPTISISSQPASIYSVCDGATPTISVSASGTTNMTFQWQIFNSGSGGYVDLTNTGGYSNVSTSSITINSTGNFGTGTYRCKIAGDFAAAVYTNTVSFSVNPIPATPTASDINYCPPNTVDMTASGGSNGQYLWYDQNGIVAGQNNNTYTTPSISATSNYSVAITDGVCVSPKVNVKAVAQIVPAAPTTADVNFCPPNTALLTASGGSNGQYLWYDQNGLINGQTNNTYTTPSISTTTAYSVAVTNGTCTSAKANVKAVSQSVSAPAATDVNFCPPNTVMLTASGGSTGQYLWYDQNGLINGQANANYTTPSISSTTSYAVAVTNGICTSSQTTVKAVAQAVPAAPAATDINFCPPNTVALTASGGSAGQYLWYDQNGQINGQTNGSYTTPSIPSTTSYSVAVTNGTCTSPKTSVKAIAQVVPPAPTTTDVSFCAPSVVVLTASGGSAGQYLWYDQNGVISGETNDTYTTPSLLGTTSYSVAITNAFCTSPKTVVNAIASTTDCSGPVITPEPLTTQVGGKIIIDLKPLISTPNSSLDLSSLQVVVPPTSGAVASIDSNGILTITYSSITFSGTENITIKACDENHTCTQQKFGIDVAGDIDVFNGISPDGANPKFVIQFIELLPETKNNHVSIFDRWENLVWHGINYDNNTVVFTGHSDSGNALPSGVYFYKIEFASGRSTRTGFISLRR